LVLSRSLPTCFCSSFACKTTATSEIYTLSLHDALPISCNIDKNGQGPAWANSLFEDNAEYGFGMKLAENYKTNHLLSVIEANKSDCEPELQSLLDEYVASKGDRKSVV